MTDTNNNLPPPEIERKFTDWLTALRHTLPADVRKWFDDRDKAAAPPRQESAEQRFARQFLNRPDKPVQPAEPWRDPRAEPPAGRWHNPRRA